MLKYALLGFLSYLPMTGYEIEGYMNVSTGNFWQAKLSQIYTTLKKLEEDGRVLSHIEAQEGRPDRRVYTITEAGRESLQDWQRTAVLDLASKKDALLLKLFFADPNDKQGILAQLRLQLDLHRQQLAFYQDTPPQAMVDILSEHQDLAPNSFFWELVRQYGEIHEASYVRWLEDSIAKIESALPD